MYFQVKTCQNAGVESASGAMVEAMEQIQDVCYYMSEVFDESLERFKKENKRKTVQVDHAGEYYKGDKKLKAWKGK